MALPSRLFKQPEICAGVPVLPSEITCYDSLTGLSTLAAGTNFGPADPTKIFISIHGTEMKSWVQGEYGPCESYGIYFGKNSPYNRFGRVGRRVETKIGVAESEAMMRALRFVADEVGPHQKDIEQLIFIIDSERVANSLVWWSLRRGWERNCPFPLDDPRRWTRLGPRLYMAVNDAIKNAEFILRCEVKIWLVSVKNNQGSKRLAQFGLDDRAGTQEIVQRPWLPYTPASPSHHLSSPDQASAPDFTAEPDFCVKTRLEFPLEGNSVWISSLRSYYLRHHITYTHKHEYHKFLPRILGNDWESLLEKEQQVVQRQEQEKLDKIRARAVQYKRIVDLSNHLANTRWN